MTAQIATAIASAVTKGFTAKSILNHLIRQFPQYSNQINNALAMGYTADMVLKHLTKGRGSNPENTDEFLTESEKTDKIDKDRKRKQAIALGTTAAAAGLGLSAMGGLAQTGAGSVLSPDKTPQSSTTSPSPGSPINPPPQVPQSPGQMAAPQTPTPGPMIGQQMQQGVQQPIDQAMQETSPQQIAGAAQAIQPQQPGQNLPSVFDELIKGVDVQSLSPDKVKQLQFLKTISDKLQQEGKPITDPGFKKLAEKVKNVVQGKPGTIIEETARIAGAGQQNQMSKGSSVITPSGEIAQIEDLPGKTAKVSVDGKKQVFESDDLVPVPDNHEEIGNLYQQLIDKIPEGDKSRVYDAIGYDPERNAIKYTYHDGKTYIIDDVPEDIAREIANSGFMAKTSGGNYMGFYYKGNPSIGAGMSVLINDLQKQRGGKGKEYSYKFEELYSQHRLPKNILKERAEKEKQREREEKKAKKKRSTP